jgi:hypothetical protein
MTCPICHVHPSLSEAVKDAAPAVDKRAEHPTALD